MRSIKLRAVCMTLIVLLLLPTGSVFAREVVRTQSILLHANGGMFPEDWPDEESPTRTVEFGICDDGEVLFINVGITPAWEGKRQLGWSTSASGTEEYDRQTFKKINEDHTYGDIVPLDGSVTDLYAVWTDEYRITLDANGGDFGTYTDRYGNVTPIETVIAKFWRDSGGSLWRTGDQTPIKSGEEIHKGWSADKNAKKPEISTWFDGLVLDASTPTTLYAIYGIEGDRETDYEAPQELISIEDAEISPIEDQTYTGGAIEPELVVAEGCLVKDVDFTAAFENNINVGTATVTLTGIGLYTGTIKATFKIVPKSIKGAKVSGLKTLTYTGSTLKQKKVVVKDGKTKLVSGTDYKLSYKNNKKAGKATIIIKGKGNYTGKLTKYFNIKPAQMKIKSAKNSAKGTITLKWAAAKSGTGYEVQYGLKKNFKGAKTIDIAKRTKKSAKIKGLKKGKNYYVRLRAYVKIDGKKVYGEWSEASKVKVKK